MASNLGKAKKMKMEEIVDSIKSKIQLLTDPVEITAVMTDLTNKLTDWGIPHDSSNKTNNADVVVRAIALANVLTD
jgi:hypothetical protein